MPGQQAGQIDVMDAMNTRTTGLMFMVEGYCLVGGTPFCASLALRRGGLLSALPAVFTQPGANLLPAPCISVLFGSQSACWSTCLFGASALTAKTS